MQEKTLTQEQQEKLIETLRTRFKKNMQRHQSLEWEKVSERLLAHPKKLWSLYQMEETGGEPDVILQDKKTGGYVFYDCSAQSPKGRRSLCYDRKALDARKQFKPKNSAIDLAEEMGVEILTEEEYRNLQELGEFDTTTSSWVKTPEKIRELGGATFADRRYDTVFLYHNGADSYYASRGFRGSLKI